MVENQKPQIKVENLLKKFPVEKGFFKRVVGHIKAVNRLNFKIDMGEVLGLVGESGCGKTTLGQTILRAMEPDDGKIYFNFGNGELQNIMEMSKREFRSYRRYMQMIFQDPFSSLDPRKTILDIVGEPLKVNNIARGKELENRVRKVVASAGLNVEHIRRFPHAFSGGQRQRIAIARALAPNPRFVVADEPVSALDVSVRAEILNLFKDLQEELELTILFIAHDLSVVRYISDRVAVMYVGKMVEIAETRELYFNPQHPYTEVLMSAIPVPDPRVDKERKILEGEVPSASNPPAGCYFHPRCEYSQDICQKQTPELEEIREDHYAACHFADKLTLRGVK